MGQPNDIVILVLLIPRVWLVVQVMFWIKPKLQYQALVVVVSFEHLKLRQQLLQL